ncbi:hypothetical protein FKM82_008533 [Ascaphus truei]
MLCKRFRKIVLDSFFPALSQGKVCSQGKPNRRLIGSKTLAPTLQASSSRFLMLDVCARRMYRRSSLIRRNASCKPQSVNTAVRKLGGRRKERLRTPGLTDRRIAGPC